MTPEEAELAKVTNIVKLRPPDPDHEFACAKLKVSPLSLGFIDDYLGLYSKGVFLSTNIDELPNVWYRAMNIIDSIMEKEKSRQIEEVKNKPRPTIDRPRGTPNVRRNRS